MSLFPPRGVDASRLAARSGRTSDLERPVRKRAMEALEGLRSGVTAVDDVRSGRPASCTPRGLPSMQRTQLLRLAFAGSVALLAMSGEASCARSERDVSTDTSPSFSADGGVVSDGLCLSTDCPAPWATCPGSGLCMVDTSRDVAHCGSCDTRCPSYLKWGHTSSLCAGGKCAFTCEPFYADCNHSADDGCETHVFDDPKNCGACGADCADAGGICWKGACGCPSGLTQCGNDCVDLDTDNLHCGSCDGVCKAPTDPNDPRWECGPSKQPPNTKWTCIQGECSMQCAPSWGDCNDAFCADGCELDLSSDPKNCGACGHACAQGQDCVEGACLCNGGTLCRGTCVDLDNDPMNCGYCGNECDGPSPSEGGGPACVSGKCSYVCNPGWADCNHKTFDGCEVNLTNDSLHCGACATKCKFGVAQPCVEGKCLSKECESGVIR